MLCITTETLRPQSIFIKYFFPRCPLMLCVSVVNNLHRKEVIICQLEALYDESKNGM